MLITQKRLIRCFTEKEAEHDAQTTQKLRPFYPSVLAKHSLFQNQKPVLFGGAALTLLFYRKMHDLISNRVIDDLDFYVTDLESYKNIQKSRKKSITFQNKQDKRLHFFEKMDEDFYIKITICLNQNWQEKRTKDIQGVQVIALHELERLKLKGSQYDPNICDTFIFGERRYFVRKAKKVQDETDISLINWLLRMNKPDKK